MDISSILRNILGRSCVIIQPSGWPFHRSCVARTFAGWPATRDTNCSGMGISIMSPSCEMKTSNTDQNEEMRTDLNQICIRLAPASHTSRMTAKANNKIRVCKVYLANANAYFFQGYLEVTLTRPHGVDK